MTSTVSLPGLTHTTACPHRRPPPPHDQTLCLNAASVKRTLSKTNTRKAAGLGNIPGRVLKDCAEEREDVFTNIFNASELSCFKPPPPVYLLQRSPHHPLSVALTSIIMRCFERLVTAHIKSTLLATLDHYSRFAYWGNRSTEDAISLLFTQLDTKNLP